MSTDYEVEYQAALAKNKELGDRLLAIKARLAALPIEITKIEEDAIALATEGKPVDYTKQATVLAGLRLELNTLPNVAANLEAQMRAISHRAQCAVHAMQDAEADAKRVALMTQINEMRSHGESPKTIRETLNLSQSEYERLISGH